MHGAPPPAINPWGRTWHFLECVSGAALHRRADAAPGSVAERSAAKRATISPLPLDNACSKLPYISFSANRPQGNLPGKLRYYLRVFTRADSTTGRCIFRIPGRSPARLTANYGLRWEPYIAV